MVRVRDLCVECPGDPLAESEQAAVWHGDLRRFAFSVDMLAIDPPWRQGNLTYWSTKAGVVQEWTEFVGALARHFDSPRIVYLKTGVPEQYHWHKLLMAAGLRRIMSWHTDYAGGRNAQTVAFRDRRPAHDLPCMQSSPAATTAIAAWAARHGVRSVADPCAGNGVMLNKFRMRGMHVVGVELVEARAKTAAVRLCGGSP